MIVVSVRLSVLEVRKLERLMHMNGMTRSEVLRTLLQLLPAIDLQRSLVESLDTGNPLRLR